MSNTAVLDNFYTLINDESLIAHFKDKFKYVYEDYESYFHQWIYELVIKYDPKKNTTLKYYVMLHLKYNILNDMRCSVHYKLSGLMSDVPLDNILDTSDVYHQYDNKMAIQGHLEDFAGTRRNPGRITKIIQDYLGEIKPKDIAQKFSVSKPYISKLLKEFVAFIREDKVRLNSLSL